jgi:hypothetical protein
MHAEAVTLLLAVAARARYACSRLARLALDLMMDTAAGNAGEDPPRLARRDRFAGTLAKARVVTGDERYLVRSAARWCGEWRAS